MAKSKSIAGKIVAGALALCVAAGGVSLLGYTSRDTNGNWFGGLHWADNNITADGGDVKNENGGAVISDGESNGMLMLASAIPLNSYEEYGVSPLAENAYSLSVSYTPSDTTYKQTSFTAVFKNPSSTWASGKNVTDYVTVTATGDTTATLTVLQPFSEQIIVTATCNRNTSIKATTTVDYVGTFNFELNLSSWDMENDMQSIAISQSNPYINGTLCPDGSEKAFTVIYDTAWIAQRVKSAGFNFTVADSVTYKYNCTENDMEDGADLHSVDVWQILRKACNKESLVYGSAEYKTWWSNLSSAILNGRTAEELNADSSNIFENVKVITHRIYNGVNYSDVTLYNGACVGQGWEVFEVSATSMSTNTSSIIAG